MEAVTFKDGKGCDGILEDMKIGKPQIPWSLDDFISREREEPLQLTTPGSRVIVIADVLSYPYLIILMPAVVAETWRLPKER